MADLEDLEKRAGTDGKAAMALAERRLLGIGCAPDQSGAFEAVKQAGAKAA